ncbi:MAG: hypothetical protein ACRC8J_04970 [Phocaeicola sp.]
MAKLSYRVSYYVLYACIAVLLAVLAVFYTVGFNNPVGEYNSPEHTETLIFLMYGILGVCLAATIVGAIAQFIAALRDNPKGAIKSLIGIVLLIAVLFVTHGMGATDAVMTGTGAYTDAFWLQITDMLIYSIYFLLIVASIGTLVNLSGLLKM